MTREDILAMPASKELDALVAGRVMGWRVFETKINKDGYIAYLSDFNPSTDMSSAWEVVEKMQEKFNFFLAYNHKDKDFQAFFDVPTEDDFATIESYQYDAPVAPEAICKAALLAIMEEE